MMRLMSFMVVVFVVCAGTVHAVDQGDIYAWGDRMKALNGHALTGIVKVAAGGYHCLALKSDGSIVEWGSGGAVFPPAGNDFVDIVVGEGHNLALKSDGSIVGWGDNNYGQASPPLGKG